MRMAEKMPGMTAVAGWRTRERRAAFTMIELLVVMAVIIILGAIAVPAAAAMGKDNSRAQARNQIRAVLAQARGLAIARHVQAGVVIFRETPKYSMPVHGDQMAMQIFVEEYDQSVAAGDTKNPRNTF